MNQNLEKLMKENNVFCLKNFFVFMDITSQKDWNNLLLSREIFVKFWVNENGKILYDLDQELNQNMYLLLKGYHVIKDEGYVIDYENNIIQKSNGKIITQLYQQHLKENNQKVSLVEFDNFVNRVERNLYLWYLEYKYETKNFDSLVNTYQRSGFEFVFDDEVWNKLRQIDYNKNNSEVYIEINDVCDVFFNKKELYERFDLKENFLTK